MLIFVPCEKVITSTEGPISLVSILEKLITDLPPDPPLPEHATIRLRWYVVTVWCYDPSEEGRTFEQMVKLASRDGTTAMHTEPTTLSMSAEKPRFRVTGTIDQFPITDGNLSLLLLCREVGTSEWTTAAEYPIDVELRRNSE